MQRLLDPNIPFDVNLYESVIQAFYNPNSPNHHEAHGVIVALRESLTAWQHVEQILRESNDQLSQFVALQILEDAVKYRWRALPPEQRAGIRNYVADRLITLARDQETLESQKQIVSRLNMVLIQILKQEWPGNWPSFIPDLVGSAKTSESLCENNMVILQLLSEEIFDFSKEEMTQTKTQMMKQALNEQFQQVFSLCDLVLDRGTRPRLLAQTLKTLLRFLGWIPLGFIFQTPLVDRLSNKFFPLEAFRNDALACLTEIATLKEGSEAYTDIVINLYLVVINKLETGMLPPDTNIAAVFDRVKESDRQFIQQLALFLTGFFATHLPLLERPECQHMLLKGMAYLVSISKVENSEIFKICLDGWNRLAADLYMTEVSTQFGHHPFHHGGNNNNNLGGGGLMMDNNNNGGGGSMINHNSSLLRLNNNNNTNGNRLLSGHAADNEDDKDDVDEDEDPILLTHRLQNQSAMRSNMGRTMLVGGGTRLQLYSAILQQLRVLMISRMTKPEEVLVRQDENGEVLREITKDTDAIALYKQMRDTLVYLTHLDVDNTEFIMVKQLSEQMDENSAKFNPNAINTLSWAIGSISGTMDEATEKRFLIAVIKDLLVLCEMRQGKASKALIASDIMYVVGQYPRFLRIYWRFLRTVVAKLFEFMHEPHPGVQDMACDTFLKLAKKCKRKFVQIQSGETAPFIDQLLGTLATVTSDLQPHQVHSFFEAVGVIIACHPDHNVKAEYIARLMDVPNRSWYTLLSDAKVSPQVLHMPERVKELSRVLRTNIHVAKATGHTYISQLAKIFLDALNVYKHYGETLNDLVLKNGVQVLQIPDVRAQRNIKVEMLELIKTFIERSEDPVLVTQQVVITLYEPVLGDYERAASPLLRDWQVIELFASIVGKLKHHIAPTAHLILKSTFASTLQMIAVNFEDFPEHRIHFYSLLKQLNLYCFTSLWSAPPDAQKQIVDAIVWGFKHTARDIADCSLELLQQLLANIATHGPKDVAQNFYSQFLLSLIQDIFYVLTDRLHKSGFKLHAMLLLDIFNTVNEGRVQVPLFDPSQFPPGTNNVIFLRGYIGNMLLNAFPNVGRSAVEQFVSSLFSGADLAIFKQSVRDFLIQIKEFSVEDNTQLYREENEAMERQAQESLMQQRLAVPGLINPNDVDDMGDL
jgi:exportin-1